jgi:hypothetical protein
MHPRCFPPQIARRQLQIVLGTFCRSSLGDRQAEIQSASASGPLGSQFTGIVAARLLFADKPHAGIQCPPAWSLMTRKVLGAVVVAVGLLCHTLATDLAAQARPHRHGPGGSAGADHGPVAEHSAPANPGDAPSRVDAPPGPSGPDGLEKGEKPGWRKCREQRDAGAKSDCAERRHRRREMRRARREHRREGAAPETDESN